MSEDKFDVYDTVDDVIVSVVKKRFSSFSLSQRWEFCCNDCLIKIEQLNNRKMLSCCGPPTTTDFTTPYKDNFLIHLQEHEMRGEEVPKDAWELHLP